MAAEKKGLRIKWTRTAELQFFHVLEYWTEKNRSTRYAEKLADLVWTRTIFLSRNPFTSSESGFPNLRRAALGPFSLYYKVQQEELVVMAFWDNRQDPGKLQKFLSRS